MNPLESQLSFPFEDRLPEPPEWLEVAPGVHWVRMPLPFALNHINLWLLRDRFQGRDGWTLIDCGISSDTIRVLWERIFADRLGGLPIVRVICTHTHPDHVGLADWITRRFEAPLWMTVGEYAQGRLLSAGMPGANGESAAAHFAMHGAAEPQIAAVRAARSNRFSALVPSMPLAFTRLIGDTAVRIGGREWQIVIGLGHSPEHAALYCAADRLLVSGDMVLPRISTNCSVYELEPMANPVEWFLSSLRRFEACDDETLVLPAHGRPFRRLKVRLAQLHEHHDDRLATVLEACRRQPLSAADAIPVLFDGRRFDNHQFMFALGESLAHLHALWYRGAAERSVETGVVRFSAR
ncbi:MAG: MBL fold metallo-hydrolase [Lautropia sp.]